MRVCGVAAILALFALPAAAQSVTTADIQRLQDQVYDASGDVSRMRGNADAVTRLQNELDDLRDEVVYLKVKLRKEGSVNRGDFNDVQRRIQDVRSQARGGATASGNNSGGWETNSNAPTYDCRVSCRPRRRRSNSASKRQPSPICIVAMRC